MKKTIEFNVRVRATLDEDAIGADMNTLDKAIGEQMAFTLQSDYSYLFDDIEEELVSVKITYVPEKEADNA